VTRGRKRLHDVGRFHKEREGPAVVRKASSVTYVRTGEGGKGPAGGTQSGGSVFSGERGS